MSRPDGSETQNPELPQSAAIAGERVYAADPDEILDLKSAARLLRYSESHLSKILAGKFPDLPGLRHVRVGRTVRIRRGALLKWFHQAESASRDSADRKC